MASLQSRDGCEALSSGILELVDMSDDDSRSSKHIKGFIPHVHTNLDTHMPTSMASFAAASERIPLRLCIHMDTYTYFKFMI